MELLTLRDLLEILIPVLVSFAASSGFWLYLSGKRDRKSLQTELLIGLAHDRIIYLGTRYIERGWVTHDEYENLYNYLYKPYEALGGNGSAKRIMDEINKLPLKASVVPKVSGDD